MDFDEVLPSDWCVEGSTGYDFLNQLNSLFIAVQNEAEATLFYHRFTGCKESFDELLYACRKSVVRSLFRGDVDNLARVLRQLLKANTVQLTKKMSTDLLVELMVAFPVYRTYCTESQISKSDHNVLEITFETAKRRNPQLEKELSALQRLLEQSPPSSGAAAWLMRLQQYTGAVIAKGMEDTALYIFNRLLSLNEVGGNPFRFGRSDSEFHKLMKLRQAGLRNSLNASSTHDTKRGEDSRARLNVLSEIPQEFGNQVAQWAEINLKKKRLVKGKVTPAPNEEYYIYQSLLASFPFDEAETAEFQLRLKQHMIKALREAKINSSWLQPNESYEEAITAFVNQIVDTNQRSTFMNKFMPFQKKIAYFGFLNSLSQTLIKIVSPGIPDFYQGSELWNLNMVDPDNRRPVDFVKRQKLLKETQKTLCTKLGELLDSYSDGKAKIYLINHALKFRNSKRDLFQQGDYIPLKAKGAHAENIIAFCRKKSADWTLALAPRFVYTMMNGEQSLPLRDAWKDTTVLLPKDAPVRWKDIFSGNTISSGDGLKVADAMEAFSVCLLTPTEAEK